MRYVVFLMNAGEDKNKCASLLSEYRKLTQEKMLKEIKRAKNKKILIHHYADEELVKEISDKFSEIGSEILVKELNEKGEITDSYYGDESSSLRKIAIIVGIVIFACICICSLPSDHEYSYSDPRERDAWVCAMDLVESQLISPSSADFCTYPEATITKNDSNEYTIKGYVDAENAFGASLRKNFIVTLKLTGSGYTDGECTIY